MKQLGFFSKLKQWFSLQIKFSRENRSCFQVLKKKKSKNLLRNVLETAMMNEVITANKFLQSGKLKFIENNFFLTDNAEN